MQRRRGGRTTAGGGGRRWQLLRVLAVLSCGGSPQGARLHSGAHRDARPKPSRPARGRAPARRGLREVTRAGGGSGDLAGPGRVSGRLAGWADGRHPSPTGAAHEQYTCICMYRVETAVPDAGAAGAGGEDPPRRRRGRRNTPPTGSRRPGPTGSTGSGSLRACVWPARRWPAASTSRSASSGQSRAHSEPDPRPGPARTAARPSIAQPGEGGHELVVAQSEGYHSPAGVRHTAWLQVFCATTMRSAPAAAGIVL